MSEDTTQKPNDEETPTGPQREPLPEELRARLGDGLLDGYVLDGCLWLDVKAEAIVPTLEVLRAGGWTGPDGKASPGFNHLSDLCGADMPGGLQVIYHLFQLMENVPAVVKVTVSRENPRVPTVTPLWEMAGWAERETMEMFGIEMVGHPYPRKLLLSEDWEGYPLRKDYVYPMDHPYLVPDPLREDPAAVLGKPQEKPADEPKQ